MGTHRVVHRAGRGSRVSSPAGHAEPRYNSGSNPRWFWKDRIKVDASVQTSWNMNLQQPSINELDLTFNLNFSIYQFLDLTFSSVRTTTRPISISRDGGAGGRPG